MATKKRKSKRSKRQSAGDLICKGGRVFVVEKTKNGRIIKSFAVENLEQGMNGIQDAIEEEMGIDRDEGDEGVDWGDAIDKLGRLDE